MNTPTQPNTTLRRFNMTLYTDKALLSYLSGYQSGYALASEYADDELCPVVKPDTSHAQPSELEYNYGFNDAYGRGVKDNYNEGFEAGLKRKVEEGTK